ncbi:MAG: DNA polymerase III subunit delta [Planctomycetes bacterium]|nr:DNA polymerase III subunit delta [Planctomycetota bacterium]
MGQDHHRRRDHRAARKSPAHLEQYTGRKLSAFQPAAEFLREAWAGIPGVFLVWGDAYLSAKALRYARDSLGKVSTELLEESFESPDHSLFDAAGVYSHAGLWGERRMVVFSSPDKPTDKELAFLEELADRSSDNFLLLRYGPIRQTRSLTTLAAKVKLVNAGESGLSKKELRNQLMEESARKGLRLTSDGAYLLLERLGTERGTLENALERLSLADPSRIWDAEAVGSLFFAEAQENVFALAEKLAARDLDGSLQQAERLLARGLEPALLIGSLRTGFRRLLALKMHGEWSQKEACEKLRSPEFAVKKMRTQADHFSLGQLNKIYRELYNLDRESKMLSHRGRDLLETFVLKLVVKG